jgi:hypothetical protein
MTVNSRSDEVGLEMDTYRIAVALDPTGVWVGTCSLLGEQVRSTDLEDVVGQLLSRVIMERVRLMERDGRPSVELSLVAVAST